MRRFLRHPSDMPVELVLRRQAFVPRQRLNNISLGGVACNSPRSFRCGSAIEMRIPLLGETARYPASHAPFLGVAHADVDAGAAFARLVAPGECAMHLVDFLLDEDFGREPVADLRDLG